MDPDATLAAKLLDVIAKMLAMGVGSAIGIALAFGIHWLKGRFTQNT